MAGFSTTTGGLSFQYPNRDTQNWDVVMANTWATLSSHDHSRDTAGRGKILDDRSLLLTNTGWLQSNNFAGTGEVNLIRANTSNIIELGANLASVVSEDSISIETNDVFIKERNAADSAYIDMFKVNSSDLIELGANLASAVSTGTVSIATNGTFFRARNNANSAFVNLITSNANDDLEVGTDIDLKSFKITTSTSNADIFLEPNGTGIVKLASNAATVTASGDAVFNSVALGGGSDTLSLYEEGTFTPTIFGSSVTGAGTYTAQLGSYTRIGDTVLFQITLKWSAHTGSGSARLAGLPFTIKNIAGLESRFPCSVFGFSTVTFTDGVILAGQENTTQAFLVYTGGTSAVALDGSAEIYISGHYKV